MLSNILEHHGRVNRCLTSLEEDLVHARREEEKLKATIQVLEREKSEMNARVALMERKDLYELLQAKMEGFQIANHLETIGGFKNLNLTISRKWVKIPTFNLEEFEKCLADYPDSRSRMIGRAMWQNSVRVDRGRSGLVFPSVALLAHMGVSSPLCLLRLKAVRRLRGRALIRQMRPMWLLDDTLAPGLYVMHLQGKGGGERLPVTTNPVGVRQYPEC
ncbi:hypothetical protein R1flu_022643 [Riccia fluitans]|uniref:Uncharacterized protein n=1 Tax=Riccia fluitans TaxID=41844 RepID=A0ABD1XSN9_9MARC